ncbi:hypothetical protein [Thermoactinomyces mirandus]|uniref:Uncharacterized protein n=1 Tax=Thermoactinomyces mirandus TaxID=2756294 RepID=A0A7W1XRL3_9BACL|nr:hypothetical protein [Thermoactinomyces mirandus]MBA4601811.1 hypothetical protein [Thermoactinomyces mirandus]
MRFRKGWVVIACMFALVLAGCQADFTNSSKEVGQMDQAEEKQLKEQAIQYIQKKYNKKFEVTEVVKGRVAGTIRIRGIMKDGRDTDTTVFWEKPDEMDDTYITTLWTEELKPEITSIINRHFEVRHIQNIIYSDGTKNDYTGDVPSVFEVLENGGDSDYSLDATVRIYENGGQYETGLRKFLKELQAMNFNELLIEIFVADDELKSAPKNIEESNYTLYRYNVNIDDIQKVDINNLDLDQYKTVIKH